MVMIMLNQFFGLKKVKNNTGLKSVLKRKHSLLEDQYISVDCDLSINNIWNTDARDALRIPILSQAHNKHSDSKYASLPAFGHSAPMCKYQIYEAIPFGVNNDTDTEKKVVAAVAAGLDKNRPEKQVVQLSLVPSLPSASDLIDTTIGVYSKSAAYKQKIQSLLNIYDLNIRLFGPADIDALQQIGSNISTWVIDLSDEEDCPVLDLLLEEYGNVASLFLSESILSSKCISKLNAFVENDTLKLTA
jgi:hypothetical protein